MTDTPTPAVSDELVERVAVRIAETQRPAGISEDAWWSIRGRDFIVMARAAIEAVSK